MGRLLWEGGSGMEEGQDLSEWGGHSRCVEMCKFIPYLVGGRHPYAL